MLECCQAGSQADCYSLNQQMAEATKPGPIGLDFVALHHISILVPTLIQSLGCRQQPRHWKGTGIRIEICENEFRPHEAEIHSGSSNSPGLKAKCFLFKTKDCLTGGGCTRPPGTMPAQRTHELFILVLCLTDSATRRVFGRKRRQNFEVFP